MGEWLIGRMKSSINRSTSFNRRALGLSSPRVTRKIWSLRPVHMIILIAAMVAFLSVGSGWYVYVRVLPAAKSQALSGDGMFQFNNTIGHCDIFSGSWVRDGSYPLYDASKCPFAEKGFNCLGNGRTDDEYVKWRWHPSKCEIPRFSVEIILERLRSKRIVFVGDSMGRTQWESLICLLMTGVENKGSVYEVNGNSITKQIRYLGVRFSSYNFTVEFFRSVFLVQHGSTTGHSPKRVRSILKLDVLDSISSEWVNSDVLIFNTGHWWVPGKLFDSGCYFQIEGLLKLGMSIAGAFRTALATWASWVESAVDAQRTRVFFRTFEPSHWRDHTLTFCNVTRLPMIETEGRDESVFSDAILDVVKNMSFPVTVLHISTMSAFRRDAHVGNWTDIPSVPDCSHWCLPGVPDTWNEILLAFLLTNNSLT